MKHNTIKKWMAVLLCLLTVASTLVILPIGIGAASLPAAWDGSSVTDWSKMKGTGSEADPYQIATPADYAAVVANAATWTASENQYFKLTADLNFGSKTIGGISISGLAPKIDGDNHTMYNVSTVWGLFDNVAAGTSIKNLHFVHFEASRAATTALIQINAGETYFENVTFDKTSRFHSTEKYAAAFIGDARASVTFVNCINEATIEAYNFGGGFIAFLRGNDTAPSTVSLTACVNAGNVTVGSAEATSDVHAGGIFGGMHTTEINVNMTNCVNVGDIAMATTLKSAGNSVGGLIGSTEYNAKQTGRIVLQNCYNGGDLSATVPAKGDFKYGTANVGGIVGYFRFGGTASAYNVFNTGEMSVTSTGATSASVNGIFGTGTDGELKKEFFNLYSVDSDAFTHTGVKAAYAGTKSVHGFAYNASVFKTYAYCDLVADANTTVKLCLAAGTDTVIGTTDDDIIEATLPAVVDLILDMAHENHHYPATCATACAVCGYARTDATAHRFDGGCDDTCNACGETRTEVGNHTSSGACDAECNVCHAALTPTADHTVTDACDKDCDVCGVAVKPTHVWENACDPECNECGEKRTQLHHTTSGSCDEECDVCGKPTSAMASHVYAGACDADCNICGKTRTPAEHQYDDEYDAECNVCKATREAPERPAPENTDKVDDTTKAPENTTEAPKDEGCGGSIAGIGALLTLTAAFGCAFVGKKED